MADIKGIELASDIYGLEDTQGRTATQTAQGTANNALNKADSNETAIGNIQNLIPANASSSNKLVAQDFVKRFIRQIFGGGANILLYSARNWELTSCKAILTAKDESGNTIWEGIVQWTGDSLGNILNRAATKYCGSGIISATNEDGTIAFSVTPTLITLDYIGEHD